MINASHAWWSLLAGLLNEEGDARDTSQLSAGAAWRGAKSRELIAHRTTVSMAQPVVLCAARRLGYRFMLAEAAWILSGDNRLDAIAPFAPAMRKLSDDGRTLAGAYGPPLVDQLPYVFSAFGRDPATRQAVVTLWRPRPSGGADVPCTLSLQWLVRPAPGRERPLLHCVASMRSSDVWMGLPYDWFTFSVVSAYLALGLRRLKVLDVDLGDLTVVAGSQHLYDRDVAGAFECLKRTEELAELPPLRLVDFDHEDQLVQQLWGEARRTGQRYSALLAQVGELSRRKPHEEAVT